MTSQRENSRSTHWAARFIVISLLAALAVSVLNSALNNWGVEESLTGYSIGLLYAICIGGMINPLAAPVWKWTCAMPLWPRWSLRCLFIMFGTGGGCLLAGIPLKVFWGLNYHYWLSFRQSFQIAMVLSAFITVVTTAYSNFRAELETTQLQLKEKEVEREKALKLATEATLSSLESRMHPHFLFNTINSISSLIQEDPARAEKMLGQMADLLRFSLDSAHAGLVPLSREMKIVRDYLDIEKARFEDRLRFNIDIPSELDEVPFPPLSLQTLVENSIKYAVGATRSGADITIRAHREGVHVKVSVEDNGPGFDSSDLPDGHGLTSLRARLDSLYRQGAAQLDVTSRAGRTIVALQVPSAL